MIFTRRTHDDPAVGSLEPQDWLLDARGELNRIEPELLAKPRFGERSCCCAAPPLVRVILPVPDTDRRVVDILLCHHHYRIAAKRLTDLGAVCIDTPVDSNDTPSSVEPVPGPRQRP